jgi:hypothetical protein
MDSQGSFHHNISIDSKRSHSLLISFLSPGNYTMRAVCGFQVGSVELPDGSSVFSVRTSSTFYPEAVVVLENFSDVVDPSQSVIRECDIGQGSLIIQNDDIVECNGRMSEFRFDSPLTVTGTALTNVITIVNSEVNLIFWNLTLKYCSYFAVDHASVTVFLRGITSIHSARAGIACSSRGNISLTSMEDGRLSVSGDVGPGIGSDANAVCDEILIKNATVEATSQMGVGIGSGFGIEGESLVLQIQIEEGNVRVDGAGGIGAGRGEYGNSTIENLTILNGIINASSSSYGSGIGSGYGSDGNSKITNLIILNGTINTGSSSSEGVSGSGIGSGYGYSGNSTITNLTILKGTINASSSSCGSGIGSGYGEDGNSTITNLTILNGTINASSSSYGSGIGSAYGYSGNSTITNLTILNGRINASGSSLGSGIGSGYGSSGNSVVANVMILNGAISANCFSDGSAIGTGSGAGSDLTALVFAGTASLVCNLSAERASVNASSILFSHASLVFTTESNRLFCASPSRFGPFNLVILYGRTTEKNTEPLSGLNGTFLHIGNVSLPNTLIWTFCIASSGSDRCFSSQSSSVRSIIVSVPEPDNYSVFLSSDGMHWRLETVEGNSLFEVGSDSSFIASANFASMQSMSPRQTRSPKPTKMFTQYDGNARQARGMFIFRFACFYMIH